MRRAAAHVVRAIGDGRSATADSSKPRYRSPTAEERYSYFGRSAFDTEEAAREQGKRFRRLGHLIVRFHVPEDAGIEWRQTSRNSHHYDLRGHDRTLRDVEERRRQFEPLLDRTYVAEVDRPAHQETE